MKTSKSVLDRYKIKIADLPIGIFEYNFVLDDVMFSYFNHPFVEKGHVVAKVTLDKRPNLIEVNIAVSGILEVQCDRCLDYFSYPIDTSEIILYTMGQQDEYENENVVIITKEQSIIDLSSDLYEIAVTQLPISKVHPNNEQGVSLCNPKMLELLNKYLVNEEQINPTQKLSDIIN
ncbi:MAG TPA: DUF177 domain-containing protein [Salinivirgaceae bacterium]|nr:DUF177 domain-containing protein [Salinivirgaceae bacterium]